MAFNVLVTDDSAVMRSMIGRILRLTGLPIEKIYTANDGLECLQIINRQCIDLLLLDINMPGLDGIGVLQTLSKVHYKKELPVIVISAETNRERVKDYCTKRACTFIGKPFSPEGLRNTILKVIGDVSEV